LDSWSLGSSPAAQAEVEMTATTPYDQRQIILYYWNKGVRTAKKIHTLTKIPTSTIYYNLKKLKNTGKVAQVKRAGRPRTYSNEVSQKIRRYVQKNPSITTRTLVAELGGAISQSTVVRHLRTLGYKNDLPRAVPMLTLLQKEKRVDWAKRHLNDDWNKTLFTDETAFQLFRNTVGQWYKGARPIRRVPKNRRKIFAWGGFSKKGKTDLFCFREIMTAEFYVGILKKNIEGIKGMLGKKFRFQQDNDPKHTSRLAKSYLEKNVPEVIDWPAGSPDLNPLENLWSLVKKNVEKRMPRNLNELESFMVEEWQQIPNSTLNSLVKSMKNRCELVLKNNGDYINY
jgi:transposase